MTWNKKALVAALLTVLVFNLGRLYEVYFGDDGPEDSMCLGKVQLSNMAEYIVGELPGQEQERSPTMYFISAAKSGSKAFAYNSSFEYTNRVYTNSVSGTNQLYILVGGKYLYEFDFDAIKKSVYLIKNNAFHACLDPLSEGVSISSDPSLFAYEDTPEGNRNAKDYRYVGSLFYQNDKILFGDAGVKMGVGDGPTIPLDPP